MGFVCQQPYPLFFPGTSPSISLLNSRDLVPVKLGGGATPLNVCFLVFFPGVTSILGSLFNFRVIVGDSFIQYFQGVTEVILIPASKTSLFTPKPMPPKSGFCENTPCHWPSLSVFIKICWVFVKILMTCKNKDLFLGHAACLLQVTAAFALPLVTLGYGLTEQSWP